MAQVLTNLPKPGEEQRYVDVINGAGGKQRLCVDASLSVSSITIGGVYIYDYNSGLGADVIPNDAGQNGLVVVCTSPAKSKVTIYGSGMIAPSGTLTLATYAVPALKRFVWTGAMVGSAAVGEFDLKIGAAVIAKVRNSGSNRTITVKFPEEPEASAGSTVEVVGENIGDLARSFETTIFGYTVDI